MDSAFQTPRMTDCQQDVAAVSSIAAVPTILDVLCRTTGMRFAAVARVTEDRWIACSVLDQIEFGLKPGGELKVETTLCHEVRAAREAVIIDCVADDPTYAKHHTPAMYGFQSYISMPIMLADGTFFGTLCAIDPKPARLKAPEIVGMFKLFAELIAFHLDAHARLQSTAAQLADEQKGAELREQFIAVLGHDLRNPLAAIVSGSEVLQRLATDDRSAKVARMVHASATRMGSLIGDVVDFTRARLGGGLEPRTLYGPLDGMLNHVFAELQSGHPGRAMEMELRLTEAVEADPKRIGQLFSNLLGNALAHGSADTPVHVKATSENGTFELSVANSGDPIAPEMLGQLFLPFRRRKMTPKQDGLGLGLYIASEIAHAHGGTLGVASTDHRTCFTFRMPLRPPGSLGARTRSDLPFI